MVKKWTFLCLFLRKTSKFHRAGWNDPFFKVRWAVMASLFMKCLENRVLDWNSSFCLAFGVEKIYHWPLPYGSWSPVLSFFRPILAIGEQLAQIWGLKYNEICIFEFKIEFLVKFWPRKDFFRMSCIMLKKWLNCQIYWHRA